MVRPVLRLGLLLRLLLLASLLLLLLVLLVLFLHHQYHHRHFPPAVVALLVSFVILPRSSPRTPPLRRCRCRCRSRRRRAAAGAAASSSYGGSPEIQMSGRIARYLGPDEKLRFILSPGWRRASPKRFYQTQNRAKRSHKPDYRAGWKPSRRRRADFDAVFYPELAR